MVTVNNPISIRVPASLREKLEIYADETGMSKKDIFVKALELFLNSNAAKSEKKYRTRSQNVGRALQLSYQMLDSTLRERITDTQLEELREIVQISPYEVKIQIFINAHKFFMRKFRDIKDEIIRKEKDDTREIYFDWVDKVLPIFEILAESNDPSFQELVDHRFSAYAAYALILEDELKKQSSNIEKSKVFITSAIKIRKQVEDNDTEFFWYELKRAIIYIKEEYIKGNDNKKKIIMDLETVKNRPDSTFSKQLLVKLISYSKQTDLSYKDKEAIHKHVWPDNISLDECLHLIKWLKDNDWPEN